MTEEILSAVDGQLFAVWFLIGAALVFWMQAGFAMVETGFTRAKNAGNILMKNLMDFCIGTVVFILIGFGLLLGEDVVGLIGKPGLDIFTAYENFDYSNFVFNLVCYHSYHRIRRYGRENQVLILLYLFRSDLRTDLSHRSTLDLGRRLAVTAWLP